MAEAWKNIVKETSTTTGVGDLTLDGAAPGGFLPFNPSVAVNDTLYYVVEHSSANERELGYGTLIGTSTLRRDTVLASTNGGNLVSLSAGTKTVGLIFPAEAAGIIGLIEDTSPDTTVDFVAIYDDSDEGLKKVTLNRFVAGDDTEIQFNDGGVLGADPGFTYDKATEQVTLTNGRFFGNLAVQPSGGQIGMYVGEATYTSASNATQTISLMGTAFEWTGTGNQSSPFSIWSFDSPFYLNSNATIYRVRGVEAYIENILAGTISNATCFCAPLYNSGSGTITTAAAFMTDCDTDGQSAIGNYGTGTIGKLIHFWANASANASGTITNLYGVKVEDQTVGTNNYAIHTSLGQVFFGDRVTIDVSTDVVPVTIQLSASHTVHAFVVEGSTGTDLMAINVTGRVLAGGVAGEQPPAIPGLGFLASTGTGLYLRTGAPNPTMGVMIAGSHVATWRSTQLILTDSASSTSVTTYTGVTSQSGTGTITPWLNVNAGTTKPIYVSALNTGATGDCDAFFFRGPDTNGGRVGVGWGGDGNGYIFRLVGEQVGESGGVCTTGDAVFQMNDSGTRADRLRVDSLGPLTSTTTTANTTTTQNVLTQQCNSSGTAGAGFASGRLAQLESSSTDNQDGMLEESGWVTATHATRASFWQISVYSTSTKQTGIRVEGDSGGVKVSLYGGTPVAKPAAITQTYSTADRTHAARTTAALADSVAGSVGTTLAAIPDPADAPASADALRDDLVANVLPKIRDAISSLADQINKGRTDGQDSSQLLNSVVDDLQALLNF